MAKVDVWGLPVKPKRTATRTFTDPEHPGQEVTVTLQGVGAIQKGAIRERVAELVEQYVTGKVDDDGELLKDDDGEPEQRPEPFLGPDGSGVRLNKTVIESFALLEEMQPPGPDRYTFADLVGLSLRMESAYQEISSWALRFYHGEPDPKNGSAVNAES